MNLIKPTDDFECLTASPEFARFSELLAKLTGVAMTLFSPQGEYRATYYHEGKKNPLCRIIRSSAQGDALCFACDLSHSRQAALQGKALLYKCHAGFFDIIIPLFVRGHQVASLSSGQILAERPSDADFSRMRKRIAWLKADPTRMRKAYFAVVYMPKAKVRHMMSLLETFATQLCESLHKIRELEASLGRAELRKAQEYVAERFADPELGLVETASHAGLSPAHFSHLFRGETGVAFTRYVQRIRLEEAKRLLKTSEQSVSEICYACGFNSLPHFIRVFRSVEQMTPGQFRRQGRVS